MLKKVLSVILAVICIVAVFSGCSDSLSDMSVAQGVGVDKTGDEVKVSVQYLDLTKGTGTTDNLGENITSVAFGTAGNISKAVSRTSANISSPVFFGQNKVIVFGDDYAKNGLSNVVDYTLRAVDSRPDVFVAMSKTTAEDVINSSENKAKVPAQDIYDMLKTGEKTGLSCAVTVKDLQNCFLSETSDVYLPVLSVKDDKTRLDGIGIFSKGKYVKTLSSAETLGFLLVNNKVKSATVILNDKKYGKVGMEITDVKVKNMAFYDNGVNFRSAVSFDINLNDIQKGIAAKLNDEDTERLKKLAKIKVNTLCRNAVKTCFESKSDPFLPAKCFQDTATLIIKNTVKTGVTSCRMLRCLSPFRPNLIWLTATIQESKRRS